MKWEDCLWKGRGSQRQQSLPFPGAGFSDDEKSLLPGFPLSKAKRYSKPKAQKSNLSTAKKKKKKKRERESNLKLIKTKQKQKNSVSVF
jgi:hypothetical protein